MTEGQLKCDMRYIGKGCVARAAWALTNHLSHEVITQTQGHRCLSHFMGSLCEAIETEAASVEATE